MLSDPLPAGQCSQCGCPELLAVAVRFHPEPGCRVVTAPAEQLVQLGQPVRGQLDYPGADGVQQPYLLELVRTGGQLLGGRP